MNEKRLRKFQPLKARRDLFLVEGSPDSPLCLVSWGSMAGVAIEAARIAQRQGIKVKLLVPRLLYPVSEEVFQDFFLSVKRGLVVEQNHQAQLFRLLRMFVDVPRGIETLAKSGSNPITPPEVVDRLRKISLALQQEKHREPTLG
jgi:2-oxoglutarate ferredoxin oxidoreductase subunit alpha